MFPEQIIYLVIPVSITAYFFYFRDIFYGETRPNLVSWFMWMLPPFLGVFFQLKAGAGLSVLSVFIAGFGPLLVVLISLWNKNRYWKITTLDVICGTLSLIALILYFLVHNLVLSISLAILSDGLATIPTLVKTWEFPETESSGVYWSGVFNNTLGVLIIKDWKFSIYSFGIYLVLINLVIIFCIYNKKIFRNFSVDPSLH